MLQVHLKVIGGKHDGRLIPIASPKFLIGREQDCHLRPNSDLVSRHHCVLSVDQFSVRLRDLGSTNGTFINDDRLRGQQELNQDDEVLVGKLRFSIQVTEVAPAEPDHDDQPTDPLTPAGEQDTVSQTAALEEDTVQIPTPDSDQNAGVPQEMAAPPGADGSETTIFNMPAMPPQMPGMPYPQQPGVPYPQQPGYPAYGYPQQPGMPYPQQPGMPYPQQPGMPYPQQPGAPQQYPQQGVPGGVETPPQQTPQDPSDTMSADGLALRLPDPTDTGAKPPEPKKAEEGDKGSEEEKPSNSAADIIKQYMNRRPGG